MLLAVVLALGMAGAEGDTPRTGQWLLHICEAYKDGTDSNDVACHYYVAGFMDAFAQYQGALKAWTTFGKKHAAAALSEMRVVYEDDSIASQPMANSLVCVPTGATYEQVVRVIVKYLRDHPERLHRPRRQLMLAALEAAFPCPKEK